MESKELADLHSTPTGTGKCYIEFDAAAMAEEIPVPITHLMGTPAGYKSLSEGNGSVRKIIDSRVRTPVVRMPD